ncbi:HD-GYP domain-containing protein [Ferrovibrio xuzhouensis]|uniref:HD-GYP domain-containing protein n=1 Tax=Ferrovibrio xuzhouensis TaxID=1576914 RepID=A0ABV7VEE6_9PROT
MSVSDSSLLQIYPVVRGLARTAHAKDAATYEHGCRMVHSSAMLGEALGLDTEAIGALKVGSLLHDIGKCAIPDAVLFKPGRLEEAELRLMKRHSSSGHELLSGLGHPWLDCAAEVALFHHERHDGGGYPRGLAGEDIPLFARIVALTDVYDALRADRPYKKGTDHDEAVRVIAEGDHRTQPGHFDPEILAAFMKRAEDVRHIYRVPEALLNWPLGDPMQRR